MRLLTPAVLMLLLFTAAILAGCTPSSDVPLTPSGTTVKLVSADSGQYIPAVIRVKQGDTLRIEGDIETLVAGMDTVVIEGYGIEKKIAPNDNIIEFKADNVGDFRMRCANGMGNGRLIVEP